MSGNTTETGNTGIAGGSVGAAAEQLAEDTGSHTLATVARAVQDVGGVASAARATATDAMGRVAELEGVVSGMAGVVKAAEASGGLLQDVINFLHFLFPAHGAPGTVMPRPADDPPA